MKYNKILVALAGAILATLPIVGCGGGDGGGGSPPDAFTGGKYSVMIADQSRETDALTITGSGTVTNDGVLNLADAKDQNSSAYYVVGGHSTADNSFFFQVRKGSSAGDLFFNITAPINTLSGGHIECSVATAYLFNPDHSTTPWRPFKVTLDKMP